MPAATHAELGAHIESALASGEFSGVVQVTVADETVFAGGYGLADRAAGIANTIDTRFGIASATKLMTALGIGVLIDEGRLALSSRLIDAVSVPLPGVDPAVTIGQLLSHTSGVFDYFDEELITDPETFQLPVPPATLLRPSDYLPMLTGPQKFSPGARFSYSNGGYVLLGLVIEELTGSFHDHLDRRILQPCRMRRSGFFRLDRLPPDTAIGYVGSDSGTVTNTGILPVIGGPDGGMFATVGDLQRLWRCLLAGEIISAQLVAAYTAKSAHYHDDFSYGYGLWIRDDGIHPPVHFIQGGDAGVSIRSSLYPPLTVVTTVSNSTDGAWPIDKTVNELVRDHAAAAA